MRETEKEKVERLCKYERGRALLSLLVQYGSADEVGRMCHVSGDVVRNWIKRGYISARGAMRIEQKTGRMKEEFRPDLSAEDWLNKEPGLDFDSRKSLDEWEGEDSKTLLEAAIRHGGTRKFCRKAGISVNNFHTWKSRNRIPAIKLPIILALAKGKELDTQSAQA